MIANQSAKEFSSGRRQDISAVEFKIAENRHERNSLFRLVYDAYLRAGLERASAIRMRVTPYHLLPTTDAFVAKLRDEVISTLSLVVDADLGLPMELVFPDQVGERRERGLCLAEATCLADRRRDFRRALPVFAELCRLMVQTARVRGVDELLVAVHPRHVRFYQRFLAFEVISDLAEYPAVCNRPAVALSLNFNRIDRERPWNYDRFFGKPIPAGELAPRPISLDEAEYLRSIIDPGFVAAPIGPADRVLEVA